MKNRESDDAVLVMCERCAVLVGGAAFAALLYELITAAVPLVESMMSQRMLMTMSGF